MLRATIRSSRVSLAEDVFVRDSGKLEQQLPVHFLLMIHFIVWA